MTISVVCPRLRCRAILRVPENVRGKQVRCSACGNAFVVPVPPAEPVRSRPEKPKPQDS